MKIVKTPEEFKPVSIVLESQKEVDWIYDLLGSIGGAGEARKFFDSIYYELESESKENTNLFDTFQIKAH